LVAFFTRLVVGLLALSLLCGPAAAADKPPPITLDAINAGLAAAPGLVSQSRIDCQVSDARQIGEDLKTKSIFYELACNASEGFVIGAPAKGSKFPMVIYSCLEAAGSKSAARYGATCRLPENDDPKAGIEALIAKYRPSCRVTNARAIGHSDTGTALEVACQDGAGYLVQASYPLSGAKPASFSPCAGVRPDMNLQCTLTDAAATNTYLAGLVGRAGKTCEVNAYRFVGLGRGISDNGDAYYEVACAGGGGLMLDVDSAGGVFPTACAGADYIAGGCKLSKPARGR
jgi:hypothetical protein